MSAQGSGDQEQGRTNEGAEGLARRYPWYRGGNMSSGEIDFSGKNFAAPLWDSIGPGAFNKVAEWMRAVAAQGALELTNGKVISPSVAWLAEVVSFYVPAHDAPLPRREG